MNLTLVPISGKAKIKEINHPFLRTKLLEMGVASGNEVTVTMRAPFGGPIAFRCGNSIISIRLEDAHHILVN